MLTEQIPLRLNGFPVTLAQHRRELHELIHGEAVALNEGAQVTLVAHVERHAPDALCRPCVHALDLAHWRHRHAVHFGRALAKLLFKPLGKGYLGRLDLGQILVAVENLQSLAASQVQTLGKLLIRPHEVRVFRSCVDVAVSITEEVRHTLQAGHHVAECAGGLLRGGAPVVLLGLISRVVDALDHLVELGPPGHGGLRSHAGVLAATGISQSRHQSVQLVQL